MANVNVNLTGVLLQVLDLTSNLFTVNVPEATLTLPATVAEYAKYVQIPTTGLVLTLPSTTVWFVWIRNLAATGLGNLTIQKQVTGGTLVSAVSSEVLTPGGLYVYANPTEGAGGITALTLTGSQLLPAEILVAY